MQDGLDREAARRAPARRTARVRPLIARSRLLRSRRGSALVEYALLAPVFFMLISGLIEFVLFQYKTYALNHVVYEAARNLQTGEVQKSADMAQAFHDEACTQAGGMIDCNAIVFDVRSFAALNAVTYPPVDFDDQGNPVNFVFEPGGPQDYSVVRASIHHQFVTPFMAEMMGMGQDLPAIVNAFVIVRNEPYS